MGEGIVREFGTDIDTLLYLTWRASKDLLSRTGNSAQSSVITLWGKDGEGIVRAFGRDMDSQSAVIGLSGSSHRNREALSGTPGESSAFVKVKQHTATSGKGRGVFGRHS